jgi:hypothetical protein
MAATTLFSASVFTESLTIAPAQSVNQTADQNANASTSVSAGINIPAATAPTSSNAPDVLTQDLINLLKTLATGNISGAKSDVKKLQTDLQAQAAATPSGTQATSPLNTLVKNISNALSSGSVQGALQDLANYLVQNGQGSGGLINTST